MILEALAAYLHFVSIIATGGLLTAELILYRGEPGPDRIRLLVRVDRLFLAAMACLFATGALQVFLFGKGTAFYIYNPVFLVKFGLFAGVALLSIRPTHHYLSLAHADHEGAPPEIDDGARKSVRRHLIAEVLLFLLIPLFAALMARGIGN